jgi:hypothetical protein
MALKVLAVGFNPTENNQSVADKYFKAAMGNVSAEQYEQNVFTSIQGAFDRFSNHEIQFEVVKTLHFRDFPTYPNNFRFTLNNYSQCVFDQPNFNPDRCDTQKFSFDYVKWIQDAHICQEAEAVGADEIWMLSPSYMLAWENFMIGPDQGFDVNGHAYAVPGCKKHYIVLNGTYDRPDTLLHDYSHRIEATFNYLTENWKPQDREQYWERFAATKLYTGQRPVTTFCGNGHFPSNATRDYDYSNNQTKQSTCADWPNFPDFTNQTEQVNCQAWGCTDQGWQEYLYKHIPRKDGQITLTSQSGKTFVFNKNWWTYILYPEEAIQLHQKTL